MGEWKEFPLGVLTTKIGSGATPSGGSNSYKLEGISLIRSQNVLDLGFSYDGLARIDDDQADGLRNVIVEKNDVLLNITGDSVARVCKVPEDVLPARVNQHVAIIRSDDSKLSSEFLLYYLQAIKETLLVYAEIGATRNALTKGMIENLPVVVPDLPEQKAIAGVLSSLDDKIDLLHRQNKTLESLAQTLFRQWFIEEADDSWENGVITDLVELNPKRILSKGTVAPYLEMSNLSNSLYHPTNWYDREFGSGTKFINGDTLLARITPCLENGKTGFVDFLEDEQVGWGSTEFIVMRAKEPLHPFFTYILARHQDFRDFAIGCMVGSSGRQRADVDNLATYEIRIPPTDVIDRFNNYIEPSLQKMKLNNNQIRDLVRLRDSLLPKLMSGKVALT